MAQRTQTIVSTSLSDENTATWANSVTLFRTLIRIHRLPSAWAT
jgi:hypothetical protein